MSFLEKYSAIKKKISLKTRWRDPKPIQYNDENNCVRKKRNGDCSLSENYGISVTEKYRYRCLVKKDSKNLIYI